MIRSIFFTFLIIFPFFVKSQCNTDITICSSGNTAGPFSFTQGSANPGMCLDFENGQFSNNYAYIILYITQSGDLNLLIQGSNTTENDACLDVEVFDITNSVDPCGSLNTGTSIACNYIYPCNGCAEFGDDINQCEAQVATPWVEAGDILMILVEDWSDAQNTFTLELGNTPTSAQTGSPVATINTIPPICENAPAIQLTATNMGGLWTGSGISPDGIFDPSLAGVGTHVIDYTIGSAPCQDDDQIEIEVIDCESCEVQLDDLEPKVCLGQTLDLSSFVIDGSESAVWTIDSTPYGIPANISGNDLFDATDMNVSVGVYKLFYTLNNDNNCYDSLYVSVNSEPIVDIGSDPTICQNSSPYVFDATTVGASYEWNDGSTNPTLSAGSEQWYWVDVSVDGCSVRDSVFLNVSNSLQVDIGPDQTICPGGVATFSSNFPNETNDWNNGSSNLAQFSTSIEGEVILEVMDDSGCYGEASANVFFKDDFTINLGEDVSICEDEPAVTVGLILPRVGLNYSWNTGSSDSVITINNEGTYSLTVDSAGCSAQDNIELLVYDLPQPQLQDEIICEGESFTLSTGLTGSHLWSDGSSGDALTLNNIQTSDAGFYTVAVSVIENCTGNASMQLTVNPKPQVQILSTQSLCEGETLTLNTNLGTGYDFLWNGNETSSTLSVQTDGIYNVIVTDQITGCEGTDEISVDFLTIPEVYLPFDSIICEGSEWYITPINIEDISNYDFNWSTGESSKGIVVGEADDYWLSVKNQQCEGRDTISVGVNLLPKSNLRSDTVLCFDDIKDYPLNPGRSEYYRWNDGDTSNIKYINEPGLYIVELISEFGCITEDDVEIKEDCPSAIWLPSAFTPDGNGLNDYFEIKGRGIEEVELKLFNRWGELVWVGNNIGEYWDGTIDGKLAKQGVFVYKLNFSHLDSRGLIQNKSRVGSFILMR